MLGAFWQDLCYGLRLAARRPGFTAVAVVALALGIGPNTAVFSVVNTLLLTPPPYDDPDRIVTVAQVAPEQAGRQRPTMPSTDDIQDWRAETRTLDYLAVYAPDSLTLTGFGDPIRLSGARVSPALFPLLGVRPMVGRTFTDEEERPGAAPVVLVSYALWDQKLGRDPAVVGRPIVLDGVGREVVGVMPASFAFPGRITEYWVPFVLAPPERNPNERRIAIVPFLARLKPGVSIEQAAAEGHTVIVRNQGEGPPDAPPLVRRSPGSEGRGGEQRLAGEPGAEEAPRGAARGEGAMIRRGPEPGPGSEAGPERGRQVIVRGGPEGGRGEAGQEGGRRSAGGGPETVGGPAGGEGGREGERAGPGAGPGGRGGPGGPVGPGTGSPLPRLPLRLVTLQERQSGQLKSALFVLAAAVGFVLLIACANVANLLLSRVTARTHEFSIRAALGAGRGRLIRQMLTEGVVLSALAGAAGLLFAYWAVGLLPRLAPATVQQVADVRLDVRVLVFAALLSLVTTVLFALAPALAMARGGLAQALKERAVPGTSRFRLSGRHAVPGLLTVAQVALALMLLLGAGLLARSLLTLLGQDLGYQPDGALTVQIQLPRARYPLPQTRTAFLDQVLAGIRTLPGVEAAGATNLMPMSQAQIRISFELPGVPVRNEPNEPAAAGVRLVSPGLFKALGTRFRAGRDFTDADQASGQQVVIVNTAFVTRYLSGIDAVGREIELDGPRRVVGVVESMKPQGLDSEPVPEMYFPMTQFRQLVMGEGPLSATTLVVRTSGEPTALVPAIRAQVARLDPQLPLFNVMTLRQRVSDSVAGPRMYALLLGVFAALALVLASVGIYGVLSSQVAQSTREIGIQMALGAGPARIRRAVLGRAVTLAAAGLGAGLAGAWALSRFLSSMLFGITPFDPPTYVAGAGVLAAVALGGAYLPARRATEVDPVVALRQE